MSITRYIKTAFLNRWNLLAFGGMSVFAVLTGRPDIALPLVFAGELGYLGLLGTHPRFQKYVDAQDHKARNQATSANSQQSLKRMMSALPAGSRRRFETLVQHCAELKQIARDIKSTGEDAEGSPFNDLQLEGLDRLLWIYLKLLFTEHSLGRFFEKTDADRIRREVEQVKSRLAAELDRPEDQRRGKIVEALEDNLQTCESRLENYDKATENHELIELQIRRLENKIQSLGEMAVNRREPDFITGQVDAVATSMLETQQTLNELEAITGLHTTRDEPVPELIRRRVPTSQ